MPESSAVEAALADAERNGFRLAVVGRTCALVAIAAFYLSVMRYPNNLYVAGAILAIAAIGMASLALIGRRHERAGRYAFFTIDVAAISFMLAFAPLSSGGDVPQNLVFLVSRREEYYFVVVAVSVLALSPALVLWTGFCAVVGLAAATTWILVGMDRVVSTGDLPLGPSRDDFLAVVLSPDFLGIPARVNVGLVIALITCVAALAVHRARNVVRAHAAVEAKRSRVQQLLGRYVPAQVAEQLVDAGRLAPQLREASVLFADIEGFTSLSEHLPAPKVISLLNSFFSAATARVEAQGGIVVNHVGDALIAAFNAPLPVDGYPARAVEAARELQSLVSAQAFDGHRLRLRIGIASGPVAAGTVGGATRQTYTVYGDTVNLAQRLERMNKELETDCLICGATFAAARSDCPDAAPVGTVQVRGRESSVEVFALNASASR
ncbi:MAG TPA: adenylate/guanylate cyclase domain-containing protein [Vineibacter sp.]|nr:adenylate/guanylate cyclase domain-containing protein [Vineibacter sp.]